MLPDVAFQLIPLPPYMSQLQFASLIGETPDTVRGWVEQKTIPVVKVGKKNFINLKLLSDDLSGGKTIFTRGDYE